MMNRRTAFLAALWLALSAGSAAAQESPLLSDDPSGPDAGSEAVQPADTGMFTPDPSVIRNDEPASPGPAWSGGAAPPPPVVTEALDAPEPEAPIGHDSDDALFPRYAILKPNVTFWTKVFSEYSENQSIVHFMGYPNKIVEILDLRAAAAQMSAADFYTYRRTAEGQAKAHAEAVLAQVDAARNDPSSLTGDAARMYRLFADVPGDDKFKAVKGTIRTQRGLRERTKLALETSGRYLPAMEGVFRGYGMPVRLTRLPLVESSFNVEAYSKVGAAGLWQFMPSSARIYMRLDNLVDDRRDPWTSTDAAARHLRDDYAMLGAWPLALTAYNHGRGGVARGLQTVGGTTLPDLIRGYQAKSFGFASRNFYAEFLAAYDVERNWQKHFGDMQRNAPLKFDTVQTHDYVPYQTLERISSADADTFRRLNPSYRPEVTDGKFYVPPGHSIRVPAGTARSFEVAYSQLGSGERFERQRVYYRSYKVRKGDSLAKIARKFGVTQADIRSASGLSAKAKLRSGQVLKVPPAGEAHVVEVALDDDTKGSLKTPESAARTASASSSAKAKSKTAAAKAKVRTHKVKSGQTLSSIAQAYNVSLSDLRSLNGLGRSSRITVGQRLKVPS